METSEHENAVLRNLQFMLLVNKTTASTGIVQKLTQELSGWKKKQATSPSTIIESSFLSEEEDAPYYAWFHIDTSEETGRPPEFFLHIGLRHKPKSRPPKNMISRKESGKVAEWFFSIVEPITAGGIALVEAELQLDNWRRADVAPVPQLVVDGTCSMESCGVEYKAKGPGDIRSFRWSSLDPQATKVWISYILKDVSISRHTWEEGGRQCVQHLRKIF
ncbi:hypothetical protein WME97_41335 [Sorangium sp. So ce367]|uniref:hypothetical protein n=1 Tax=Sorangium sp. So ce367 TaxID=3133305 RepID=UPI003F624E5E